MKATSSRLAETEGFEPPKPFGLTVFKTAAIDHSAISPLQKYDIFRLVATFGTKKKFFFVRHYAWNDYFCNIKRQTK